MENQIEKRVELNAPVSRVWRALTDHREFGEWFRVKLEGPFVPGQVSHGRITHPGYEHVVWQATVKEMKPESVFSFTWHPYARRSEGGLLQGAADARRVPAHARRPAGTLLVITESGFDHIPAHRRMEALRMNTMGWEGQAENIAKHVSQGS